MENKQTAVEWLAEQRLQGANLDIVIEQAKQMEKEQMIDAILDNRNITSQVTLRDAEQYYNETFGGNNG
jgi:DNA polymerase II large subunit